jgi:hypothetical protein
VAHHIPLIPAQAAAAAEQMGQVDSDSSRAMLGGKPIDT